MSESPQLNYFTQKKERNVFLKKTTIYRCYGVLQIFQNNLIRRCDYCYNQTIYIKHIHSYLFTLLAQRPEVGKAKGPDTSYAISSQFSACRVRNSFSIPSLLCIWVELPVIGHQVVSCKPCSPLYELESFRYVRVNRILRT